MNYKYFNLNEFYCNCNRGHSEQIIDERLVVKLDLARDIAGIPFVITSGYRCASHNKDIGGKVFSAHLIGKAADIRAKSSSPGGRSATSRFLMLNALLSVGFTRIGIGDNFIHVDIDEDKPQNVIWLYE